MWRVCEIDEVEVVFVLANVSLPLSNKHFETSCRVSPGHTQYLMVLRHLFGSPRMRCCVVLIDIVSTDLPLDDSAIGTLSEHKLLDRAWTEDIPEYCLCPGNVEDKCVACSSAKLQTGVLSSRRDGGSRSETSTAADSSSQLEPL